jgi:hypothetical protein
MKDGYLMRKMKRIFFIAVLFGFLLWSGPASPLESTWEALRGKAETLRATERYSEALKTYEALLKLTRETFGEKNWKVAEVLIEMALVHRYNLGDEKRYDELQERAKKVRLTLNGALNCREPEGWSYESCRERWLGEDPCFTFRQVPDYIKVTYYGLPASKFEKPEAFIENLGNLFGTFNARETVKFNGRETTRIKLRYEQRRDHDRDGRNLLPRFYYEEFLILPLSKGFLVFNFNLNHDTPLPLKFEKEDAPENLYGAVYDEYQTWTSFTESCEVNP